MADALRHALAAVLPLLALSTVPAEAQGGAQPAFEPSVAGLRERDWVANDFRRGSKSARIR